MHIHIQHHENFRFTATTEEGHSVPIDSSSDAGPSTAASPMQLVAAAIGGCSAIDIVGMLKKSRQTIDSFEIEVDGERAERAPRVFTTLHVHFALTGDLTEEKVRRAVELSLNKYCSVSRMLEKAVQISATFSVNGERFTCALAEQ